MTISSVTVEDAAGLTSAAAQWDALAVECGKPACSPAWMLGWHGHVLPDSSITSVLAYDGDSLVGVAPLVLDQASGRNDVRIMGAGLLQRIGLLARPGAERALASAVAEYLGHAPRPDVIAFEGVSMAGGWPTMLREGLVGHASSRLHRISNQAAPTVTLEGHSFESWMSTRSANFRSEMRRTRRRLEQRGGRTRLVTGLSDDLDEVVSALGALHRGRWAPVGHTGVIDAQVQRLILGVAQAQAASHRLRLWVVEVDGEPISVQVFLAAGTEVIYWNGGWNDAFSDLKPGMLGILAAIEDGIARGDRRLDLGGGAQPYKLRFADADDPLEWSVVAPIQARYPRTRVELLRQQTRSRASRIFRRLPPAAQQRVRSIVRRD